MKRSLASLILGVVVIAAGLGDARAADSVVGSWVLNLAKSNFSPGPAPKELKRTYAEGADGVTLTFTGTTAGGYRFEGKSVYRLDGKDYPYTGLRDYDSLSVRKINDTTLESILKKDGRQVGTAVRIISPDGRSLTFTNKFTDIKGVAHTDVAVFDKQ